MALNIPKKYQPQDATADDLLSLDEQLFGDLRAKQQQLGDWGIKEPVAQPQNIVDKYLSAIQQPPQPPVDIRNEVALKNPKLFKVFNQNLNDGLRPDAALSIAKFEADKEKPNPLESLYVGAGNVAAGAYDAIKSTGEILYKLAAIPQNLAAKAFNIPSLEVSPEKVYQQYPEIKRAIDTALPSEAIRKNIIEKYSSDNYFDDNLLGYLKKGDYGNFGRRLGYQILEQLPQQVEVIGLTVLTGNPSMAAATFGANAFGTKYQDLKQKNMPEISRISNAINVGLSEYLTENYLGTLPMLKNILEGKQIAVSGLKQGIKEYIKNTGKVASEEGLEEVTNQLYGNLTDILTNNRNQDGKLPSLWDGVFDSGVVGFATGGILGSGGTLSQLSPQQIKSKMLKQRPVEPGEERILAPEAMRNLPPLQEDVKEVAPVPEQPLIVSETPKVEVNKDIIDQAIIKNPEEQWKSTPGQAMGQWQDAHQEINKVRQSIEPEVKQLKAKLSEIKGKTPAAVEQRKAIKSKIDDLESQYKALEKQLENDSFEANRLFAEDLASKAKASGIPDDYIDDFVTDYLSFVSDQPYIEENKNKTYGEVFEREVEKYKKEVLKEEPPKEGEQQYAEKVGTETKEIGERKPSELVGGEEERLRLRDIEENRVGPEYPKAPEEIELPGKAGEVGKESVIPPKKKLRKNTKEPKSWIALINQRGGIKPTKDFENIPLSVKRNNGIAIDDLAKTLQAEGILVVPNNLNPSDALYQKLINKEQFTQPIKQEKNVEQPREERLKNSNVLFYEDLKEGDKFKIEGEKFEVVDKDSKKAVLKDGVTHELTPGFSPINIDKGSFEEKLKIKSERTEGKPQLSFAPPAEMPHGKIKPKGNVKPVETIEGGLFEKPKPKIKQEGLFESKIEPSPEPKQPEAKKEQGKEAAVDQKSKEPWEMTREEYISQSPYSTADKDFDKELNMALMDGKISQEDFNKKSIRNSMGHKEFWAKTRKEIENEGKEEVKSLRNERASVNKIKSDPKVYAKWRIKSSSNSLKQSIEHKKQYYQGLLDVHKERVMEALKDGKPVPLEVLKDYPELRKQEGKSVPEKEQPIVEEPKDIERKNLIERIVAKAREIMPAIVPINEYKSINDDKWYRVGGVPYGIRLNMEEKRIIGYAYQDKNGITYGTIGKTEQELKDRWKENQNKKDETFRNDLLESSPKRLQEQADYWLKEAIPKKELRKPEIKKESKQTTAETKVKEVVTSNINQVQNGVELRFKEKPSEEIIKELKSNRFRWSMKNKLWYAPKSAESLTFADELKNRLNVVDKKDINILYHQIYGDIKLKSNIYEKAIEETKTQGLRISKAGSEGKGIYLTNKPIVPLKENTKNTFLVKVKTTNILNIKKNDALHKLINGEKSFWSGDIKSTAEIQKEIKDGDVGIWDTELEIDKNKLIEIANNSKITTRNWYDEKLEEAGEFITNIIKYKGYDGLKINPATLDESPISDDDMEWTIIFDSKNIEMVGNLEEVEKEKPIEGLKKSEKYDDKRLEPIINNLDRLTYESGRFKSDIYTNLTKQQANDIDKWIVETKHPLGFKPGIQQNRVMALANEIAEERSKTKKVQVAGFKTSETQPQQTISFYDKNQKERMGLLVKKTKTGDFIVDYQGKKFKLKPEQIKKSSIPIEPTSPTYTKKELRLADQSGKITEKKLPQTNIQDFGEKIGGARKDIAERGFTKGKTTTSGTEQESWRKKYIAMQKIDGSGWTIGKKGDSFGISARESQKFATQEEAEQAIPLIAVAESHVPYQDKSGKYFIYKRVNKRKLFKVVSQEFNSREDALKYMATHAEELLNLKTNFGEEILPIPEKAARTGTERRTTDATPEMFMEVFSPRGIEFGNWNNQEERQQVMNYAFDGLLDLAEVLNIPPKALMLNGDLAIAFGARGQGLSGAKAHYESDYGVINLTKMKGAGSLAHEWFHALDHYLGRIDTKAKSEKVLNKQGDLTYKSTRGTDDYLSSGASHKSQLRPEIRDAYKTLMESMYKKAEQYVEDTKVADKFLVTARENLKKEIEVTRNYLTQDLTKSYTYRKIKKGLYPATTEQLIEFDRLTNIFLEGGDLELKFKQPETSSRRLIFARNYTNNTLDAVNDIFKAVRNRSGFKKEGWGHLNKIATAIGTYKSRLDLLNDAKNKTEKTKKVTTNYAIEAKKMDQARSGDYWSEPTEMAARAFASYVEDKISEQGNQSDFLVYHAHGGVFLPMIDGFIARPYPEGDERIAINKLFDNFIQNLKVKETEQGTMLYQKADENIDTRQQLREQYIKDAANLLDKAIKGATVRLVSDQEIMEAALKTGKPTAQEIKTMGGGFLGFYNPKTNEIFINKEFAQRDTIFHEYAHPLVSYLKQYRNNLYQEGINLVKGTKYERDVRRSRPKFSDDKVYEEALVTAIGNKGAAIYNKNGQDQFKRWLAKLWMAVGRAFRKLSGNDKLTLDDFTTSIAMKMQSGKQILDLGYRTEAGLSFQSKKLSPQTETPAFKKWFGDSKVVDEQGKPLIMYHGTNNKLNEFVGMPNYKLENNIIIPSGDFNTVWFTSDVNKAKIFGKNIYAVYLKIENPLYDKVTHYVSILKNHDGSILKHDDKTITATVKGGSQIKSAIGNKGTFDPNNPDIMFSVAPPAGTLPPLEMSPETVLEWVQRKFTDRDVRATKVIQTAREMGETIKDDLDFRQEMELYPGVAADHILKVEKKLINGKDGFFDRLYAAGYTTKNLGNYTLARHAPSRNKHIETKVDPTNKKGSGVSTKAALMILNKYKNTDIDMFADEFYDLVTKPSLKIQLDEGMITQEEYDTYTSQWEYYVPVKTAQPKRKPMRFKGKGYSLSHNAIIKARGRHTVPGNPVIQAILDYEDAIIRTEKNKVDKVFYAFVQKYPSPPWKIIKNPVKPIAVINEFGEKELGYITVQKTPLPENQFGLWIKGKRKIIQIEDELLLRGMKRLGPSGSIKIIRQVNNYLRTVNTVLSPGFIIRNFEKDLQTAFINLGEKNFKGIRRKIITDIPSAWKGIFLEVRGKNPTNYWAQQFKEVSEIGGLTGYYDIKTLEEKVKQIEQKINRLNKTNQVGKVLRATGDFIKDLNEVVEVTTRVVTYKHLVAAGMTKKEAANFVKNITVNFNKKGEWSDYIELGYLFSKVGFQGIARVATALKNKRVRKIAVGLIIAAIIRDEINRLIGGDDYEKIDEFIKDTHCIFMIPGTGKHLKWKLSYGYNVFDVMGNIISDTAWDTYKGGWSNNRMLHSGARLINGIADAFNPLGGFGSLPQLVSPTIIDPFIQVAENKNFFGAPIAKEQPQYAPLKSNYQMYFKSVNPATKWATEKLNKIMGGSEVESAKLFDWNPEYIDHFMDVLGGDLGRTVIKTLKSPYTIYKALQPEEKLDINEIPIAREFFGQKSPWMDQRVVYDMFKESARTYFNKFEREQYMKSLRNLLEEKKIEGKEFESRRKQFFKNQFKLDYQLKQEAITR